MTWHATDDLLERYARDRLDPAGSASVEQHLLECAACRQILADPSMHDAAALDAIWDDVIDEVDQPRPLVTERLLRRIGVRPHVARLLGAAPSLRVAWLLALAVSLVAAVLLSQLAHGGEGAPVVFMVIAPLLPLAGIGAAYGPHTDQAFELSQSAPLSGARLFLYRAMAVLVATGVAIAAACLFVPAEGWSALLWLLPALACASLALALSTWFTPSSAAFLSATAWVAAVLITWAVSRNDPGRILDRLAVFEPPGQMVCLAVVLCASAVFFARLDRIDEIDRDLDLGV